MARLPRAPTAPALRVDRAERLAGVLEDAEAAARGERLQLRHRRRVAEDVDGQDAGRALPDRGLGGGRVEVQRLGIDVAEDRAGALVEQAVGRGDEAEGAGQDLVARAPSRAPAPRGAGPSCRWRRRPRRRPRASSAKLALEALPHRPQREPARSAAPRAPAPPRAPRSPAARAGSSLSGPPIGGHLPAAAGRGWKAYSSESTSASQEASMMFSETPIVPHSRSPSEESSRTRVTASVPWVSSRIRTL